MDRGIACLDFTGSRGNFVGEKKSNNRRLLYVTIINRLERSRYRYRTEIGNHKLPLHARIVSYGGFAID